MYIKQIAWTVYIFIETVLDKQAPSVSACRAAAKAQLEYGGAIEVVTYYCTHTRRKRVYGNVSERLKMIEHWKKKLCPKCRAKKNKECNKRSCAHNPNAIPMACELTDKKEYSIDGIPLKALRTGTIDGEKVVRI